MLQLETIEEWIQITEKTNEIDIGFRFSLEVMPLSCRNWQKDMTSISHQNWHHVIDPTTFKKKCSPTAIQNGIRKWRAWGRRYLTRGLSILSTCIQRRQMEMLCSISFSKVLVLWIQSPENPLKKQRHYTHTHAHTCTHAQTYLWFILWKINCLEYF